MKYKNIIKLRLPEIQLLAVVPTQLKFSIVKVMTNLQFFSLKHYFVCRSVSIWEQSYPLRLCLGQTLVLMQMKFLNNVRKVGRLVLSCFISTREAVCFCGSGANSHFARYVRSRVWKPELTGTIFLIYSSDIQHSL
jgi:hypothetical protein